MEHVVQETAVRLFNPKKWKTCGFIVVVTLTGKQIFLSGLSWLHDAMKMWRSLGVDGCADHRAAAGTVEGFRLMSWQEPLKGRWRRELRLSLRSSGKNWSEQATDCSRCLIRTDVTQHYPPQQSVLRLEQVIFEKKVQTAWKDAALCPVTAQTVNHGAQLNNAQRSFVFLTGLPFECTHSWLTA